MKASAAAVALLVPWTAACVVGPRYSPPHVAVPAAFQEARPQDLSQDDHATLETWWTGFQDPTLDDLVARAIAGNVDLKIAAAHVREARAARGIAASAALPQVDATGAYVRGERSDAVPPFNSASGAASVFGPRAQNLFQAGFDAGWELDVFGGVKHDVEAAIAQVQAAEEDRRDVLVTLLGDVARNYVELRGAQRQIQILDATVESLRDSRDLAKARYDAGLGTALDTERAEGLVQTTASRRPEIERTVKRTIHRIGVLIGQQPAALATLLESPRPMPARPPAVPAALPSELLSRRPDLRRAERDVAAATARLGVARADLFPRFSIIGTFGRRSEDAADLGSMSSQFWSIIPGVRLPILTGGRIRANIQVQEARQEQTLQRYEQAVLVAIEEVENALVGRDREERRVDALRASVDANQRALGLATDRYTSGLESFLSVLDAQRALYAAQDGVVEGDTQVTVSLIALYKALGGGWTLTPPDSPNATSNGSGR
jgi:NodT family efflux transporter outer membrane factor (OMF) lipoprotein